MFNFIYSIYQIIITPERGLEQTRVANTLEIYQQQGTMLFGYGWWANRDLEFLMKKTLNFFDINNSTKSARGILATESWFKIEEIRQKINFSKFEKLNIPNISNYNLYYFEK